MRYLIIGSMGFPPEHGVVRVDIVPEWCDVCCDITKGIPLQEEFDRIDCSHVLEHIQLTEDLIFVFWEMHRLLKVGGTLYIEVPHKDTEMAYECLGHTRFFVNNSFKDIYDNPHAKEMGYPQFKFMELHNGIRNKEKTICLTLSK